MGKVLDFEDRRYIKAVNSLPSEYYIYIQRKADKITETDRKWEDEFVWAIDEEMGNHELCDFVLFNHLLTILHDIQEQVPEFREELKTYFKEEFLEEVDNDRNFNI